MRMGRHTNCATGAFRTVQPAFCRVVLVCCAILLSIGAAVHGESPSHTRVSAAMAEKLAKHGDLTLKKTSLADALLTISELWKVNVVVGNEVSGEVNGTFADAPLSEILDSILFSNGYGYRPVGQSLVVMKLSELGDVHPMFQSATIGLAKLKPEDVVEGAKLLSSPQGKVQAIPSARSLLVVDFPDRVAMIRQFVSGLESVMPDGSGEGGVVPLRAAYLHPQFVKAESLKEPLTAVLSELGKLAVMPSENRVVVIDAPANLEMAEQVLSRVDVPRPQIRIAAYIYDIGLEDMRELGINWNHAIKGRQNSAGEAQSLWSMDSLTMVPFDAGSTGGAMTFMTLGNDFDLTAIVNALDTAGDSRLLADPNVTVLDNEDATISIVSEIPYQQLTETAQGGNIGTTAFREAGVKLRVTPRVAANGTVLLSVEPEFSRLTGFTPDDNQPIIDRRTARTVVRVVNGHTLVIGGLRTRTDVGGTTGIPYLMNMPHLGKLFRSHEASIRESELVVFIRPEIVTADQPPNLREQAALDTANVYLDQVPVGDGFGVTGECAVPGGPHLYEPTPVIEGQVEIHIHDTPEAPTSLDSQTSLRRLPRTDPARREAAIVRQGPQRLPTPNIYRDLERNSLAKQRRRSTGLFDWREASDETPSVAEKPRRPDTMDSAPVRRY